MSHLERIRFMPCIICAALRMAQDGPTFAHHIRDGQGMAQRASDYAAIPLCHEHHQGTTGIHGDRSAWRLAKLDELAALALTVRRLVGDSTAEQLEERRNSDQNAKLHAMLNDIAKQVVWHGQKLSAGVWKRLCTAAWLREEGERPVMVPALDGIGVDVIYERTSKLGKRRMSSLILWVEAFGGEHAVKWTDPRWFSVMNVPEANAEVNAAAGRERSHDETSK